MKENIIKNSIINFQIEEKEYLNNENKEKEEIQKDSDFDGLTDKEEREKYHTDIYAIDTDGDGISDLKETKEIFSNPTEKNKKIDFRNKTNEKGVEREI